MSVNPQQTQVLATVDQAAASIRDACDESGIDLHDVKVKVAILALCKFATEVMETQPLELQAYAASLALASWAQAVPVD